MTPKHVERVYRAAMDRFKEWKMYGIRLIPRGRPGAMSDKARDLIIACRIAAKAERSKRRVKR